MLWSGQGHTIGAPELWPGLHAVSVVCTPVTLGKAEMLEIRVKEPVDPHLSFKNQAQEASG